MKIINTDTLESWETPKKQDNDYILRQLITYYSKVVIITDNEILVSGEIEYKY